MMPNNCKMNSNDVIHYVIHYLLLHIWKCWLKVLWGDNVLAKLY